MEMLLIFINSLGLYSYLQASEWSVQTFLAHVGIVFFNGDGALLYIDLGRKSNLLNMSTPKATFVVRSNHLHLPLLSSNESLLAF